jgi:hypothetical protein
MANRATKQVNSERKTMFRTESSRKVVGDSVYLRC